MLRIFHTADVHVGLRFTRGYPDALQKELIDERIQVVERMADLANNESCDLFVVAGDLFDHLKVSKASIRKTAEALSRFQGVVAVLPGNHDYIQDTDDPVWPVFVDALGEGHLLLKDNTPYDLEPWDINAVLFPGPCRSKHDRRNAIGWIADAVQETADGKIKIGVAHGSLSGLSPDFNGDYFPMTEVELQSMDIDVWLLGHTHIRFPDQDAGRGPRIFYPSTPEPDGFDCRHSGYAWVMDLKNDEPPVFRSVDTGRFRFHDITEAGLTSENDLQRITRDFSELDPTRSLARLRLKGRLTEDVLEQVPEFRKAIAGSVRYLELDTQSLLRAIRQADINAEFTEDSFPHRLLSELAKNDADQLALQLAYELVMGARQ